MDAAALFSTPLPQFGFIQGRHVQRHRMRGDRSPQQQFLPPPIPRQATSPHASAALAADHRQAEYYVHLLTLNLRHIDYRINKCRAAITHAEAAGDIENVVGFRDLLRIEQQDRRTVEAMIAHLQRRFLLPGRDGVGP